MGALKVWNGSAWEYIGHDGAAGASGVLTVGTSLPGSPSNGDEYGLKTGSGDNARIWHCKYDSGISDSYKWRVIGDGQDLFHEITTFETLSSGSYADLTTPGPTVTVPNAGIYRCFFQLLCVHGNTVDTFYSSLKIGSAATADADGINTQGVINNQAITHHRIKDQTCAASDVLKVQHKSTGGTLGAYYRYLRVTPLRII